MENQNDIPTVSVIVESSIQYNIPRHDIVLVTEYINCNPNGDPDWDNQPRTNQITGRGIITGESTKRRLRDYIHARHANREGYGLFVAKGSVLNNVIDAIAAEETEQASENKGKKLPVELSFGDTRLVTRAKMLCDRYFDVRMFGAVASTGKNCGQIKGPVSVATAQSVAPVDTYNLCLTRCAATEQKKKGGADDDGESGSANQTMGRRNAIGHGVYVTNINIDGIGAADTGLTQDDIDILLDAIRNYSEFDTSASRPAGSQRVVAMLVVKHASGTGTPNMPCRASDLLSVKVKDGVETPSSIADYDIHIQTDLAKQAIAAGATVYLAK